MLDSESWGHCCLCLPVLIYLCTGCIYGDELGNSAMGGEEQEVNKKKYSGGFGHIIQYDYIFPNVYNSF